LAVLAPLKEDYPSLTTDEGSHPFTECALFADNIKATGYSWQSPWHFIDIPYYSQGGDPSQYSFKPASTDLVGALNALVGMLTNTGDYKSTTYYQQIAASFPNPADQLSFALRLVIHYVGDIH
jgi:S1/P1 Nuclease